MNGRMEGSDEELYRRMKKGDRAAFAELYERREPGIFRYAMHATGSPEAAEEIAHEVFVQLMNPASRFDDTKGNLEGWIFGVARNLIRTHRRRGQPEEPVEQAVTDDLLGNMIYDEKMATLRNAIRELPDNYREAVVLCDLEERNYDEAAQLMGCPIGTVRSRLHRARALLAARLKRLHAGMEAIAL